MEVYYLTDESEVRGVGTVRFEEEMLAIVDGLIDGEH